MARLSNNASLFLEDCLLADNTATSTHGIIYLDKGKQIGPSRVAVSGGELRSNAPQPIIATHSDGTAYASPRLDIYNQFKNSSQPALDLQEAREGLFLSADDPALRRIREV